MTKKYDVIIVGAGAAGMMSAIEAGKRGRKVLLVDHAKKIGEKIRISGGGRCNFTNTNTHPSKFISKNPKFIISALSQYTQNDFINLIKKHNIKYHEKKLEFQEVVGVTLPTLILNLVNFSHKTQNL